MKLTAVYIPSGGMFAAWIVEIPGVTTQGKTKEEARANLREALELINSWSRDEDLAEYPGVDVIREEFIDEPAE